MNPVNVLVSLYKGYGLGDAVQMSAVLRHLTAARPHWRLDFQAEEGKHQVGRGIARQTFAYGEPYPANYYDVEAQIVLYSNWLGWTDRPNTRVSSCLHERFDLPWDERYGWYRVQVGRLAAEAARTMVYGVRWDSSKGKRQFGDDATPRMPGRYVAVHYQGDSAQPAKNLSHEEADAICQAIERLGCTPIILDWRDRCPLPYRRLVIPREWGRDAEMVTAVIAQCAGFVGIDSGPAKCASATATPSLVVWTDHHPAEFHDPAPNTTHLCPCDFHERAPVNNNKEVIAWFNNHYAVRCYDAYTCFRSSPLTEGVKGWLQDTMSSSE